MITKKENNPIHSLTKVGNETLLNYATTERDSATEFINGLKSHTLETVITTEDLFPLFPEDTPLRLEPQSMRGKDEPRPPKSERSDVASAKHAETIRAMVTDEPYTKPEDIP
jgi:hypothetical protein